MDYTVPVRRRRRGYPAKRGKSKAQKVENQVKRLKPYISKELSTFSVHAIHNPTTAAPSYQNCHLIAEGNADGERSGIEIKNHSLRVACSFQSAPAATSPAFVRMLVVRMKQLRGAAPAIAGVLQWTATGLEQYLSGLNQDNRKRYDVLEDRTFELPQAPQNAKTTMSYKRTFKIRDLTTYNGTAAPMTDAECENNIYLVWFTSNLAINPPIINCNTQLRYIR